MGTRWRGLLAPIDKPTGDGRRMKTGAFTHRELPLALKWQRVDDAGHDASVVVGLVDKLTIDDKAGEVWGEGELFDDQPDLPRLTEDVAEAKLMLSKKVIGPSVDAGAAEVVFVETGSDEPLSDERWEELMVEAEKNGAEPKIEMLFTRYEIAAATLVVIPAFAEARPFELIKPDDEEDEDEEKKVPVEAALVAALTASASAPLIPLDVFTRPADARVQPITAEDKGEGFLRVFGYVALFGTCHVGFKGVCRTAPTSASQYASFHRYAVDVDDQDTPFVATGRLTAGFGRMAAGCSCCQGSDDHACNGYTLGATITHHDAMQTLAYVRAGEDEHGIWVAGYASLNLDTQARAALTRQKFSGDWRDVAGNLELVEILALAREREGFPVAASIGLRNGRQVSLTAAGVVRPDRTRAGAPVLDQAKLAREVASLVLAELRPKLPIAVTAAATEHTGGMVALVPSPDDAARLAVDGGEPADELHLTLAYLGEAADIPEEAQQQILTAMNALAGDLGEEANDRQVMGDGFAVSVFNPGDENDRETAIVMGVGGDDLDRVHSLTVEALAGLDFGMPEQHAPWVAHTTLIYSDDLSLVEQLADRVGPITFDRLRVAFAGVNTDIPLSAKAAEAASTAAALISEVEHAVGNADPEAITRAAEAADLLDELEAVGV